MTDDRVALDPNIDSLYQLVRTAYQDRLSLYKAKKQEVDSSWDAKELEQLKSERSQALLELALIAVILLEAVIAVRLGPKAALAIIGSITLRNIVVGTIQLFRIKDATGAVESVIAFNDAKYGTLAFSMNKIFKQEALGTALEKVNVATWTLFNTLLQSYSVIRATNAIDRLQQLKTLSQLAGMQVNAVQGQIDTVLQSKESFVRYLKVASAQGAAVTEKIWTPAAENECALGGTVALSTLLPPAPGPILRPL
jgi:hypothetical protein